MNVMNVIEIRENELISISFDWNNGNKNWKIWIHKTIIFHNSE